LNQTSEIRTRQLKAAANLSPFIKLQLSSITIKTCKWFKLNFIDYSGHATVCTIA